MNEKTAIVLFRNDLRLDDHPALNAALKEGKSVIPVYIWPGDTENSAAIGEAGRWWLHESLSNLSVKLEKLHSRLILRAGNINQELDRLIQDTNADSVYWNRRYDPESIHQDQKLKSDLKEKELEVQSFKANLLFEPWEIKTQNDTPYQVFTPFWKNCLSSMKNKDPLPSPKKLNSPEEWPASLSLEELKIRPTKKWILKLENSWKPGCKAARKRLNEFLKERIGEYKEYRDFPSIDGTSGLSPYLHFGEISPNRIWCEVMKKKEKLKSKKDLEGINTFLSEIGWREFAHHVLFHFPETLDQPLRSWYQEFPWEANKNKLQAWKTGQTGYPLIDAGMRELWETGWMHNRVRMIVGSFLTKNLRISWSEGAKWFEDTLVDADLANNTLGWQWVAGCGADAAPYFRIFNPVSQSQKFDPEGEYLRKWVPELASLPNQWIHEPWEAPEEILQSANIELDKTYPKPIVDHSESRKTTLEIFAQIRE